jgi:iron complex transport system substrate-binding protein
MPSLWKHEIELGKRLSRLSIMRTVILCIILILPWTRLNPPAAAAADDARGGIAVTDFRGKELRMARPAERIVCLIESALTGICMLREQDRVVGVSRNIYTGSVFPYYAALDERIAQKTLPAPGNWDFVNIESVVALRPDLVIIWSSQTEAIASLEEKGIPVFGVFIRSKEDVDREVAALGKLTGNPDGAARLVTFAAMELNRFTSRTAGINQEERPGVYYMWAQGNLETSCGGSSVNDLIRMAGGRNVCADMRREHAVVNLENILSWNPDVIVMWYNRRKDPGDIIDDPQWKRVKAVRDRRVHEFPGVFSCDLWTLKFIYAARLTATWIHPELFRGMDLEREKERMLRFFYGTEFSGQ